MHRPVSGATDHDAELLAEPAAHRTRRPKPVSKSSERDTPLAHQAGRPFATWPNREDHHDEPLLPPEPLLPTGLAAGPPDFVGVGTQRCGTTWWHTRWPRTRAWRSSGAAPQGGPLLRLAGRRRPAATGGCRALRAVLRAAGRRCRDRRVDAALHARRVADPPDRAGCSADEDPDAVARPVDRYASGHAREDRLARERERLGSPGHGGAAGRTWLLRRTGRARAGERSAANAC